MSERNRRRPGLGGRGAAALLAALALGPMLLQPSAEGYLPPRAGGRLTVPLPEAPVTLDPARARRDAELSLCGLLYDTLYKARRGKRPLPRLAAGLPQLSADRRRATIRIRAGAELHDGRRLTAAVVAASLNRLARSPSGYLLAPVAEIRAEADGLVLALRRPTPELAELLSAPATAVVATTGGRVVGGGPYRLARRGPSRLLLVANPRHFAGRPNLDRLELRLFGRAADEVASFQVGALQLSRHGASVFGSPKHPALTLQTAPVTTIYLAVGKRPGSYLADPLMGAALRAAIDRRRLQRLAGSGRAEVADSLVSPRLLRYRRRRHAFDRALAQRLRRRLAQRHAALRTGRARLSLLLDASRPDDRTLAGQIIADLDRIGLEVRLEVRPPREYQARLEAGRYELALGRLALQLGRPRVALAAALAAAGDRAAAARCLARARCGAPEARRLAKTLSLIPLAHPAFKLDYDARVGGVAAAVGPAGRLDLDRLYWRRKR